MSLQSTPEHPSQWVELPADPYLAAAMFLAVLAYPEPGAGVAGEVGERYAWALNIARIRELKSLYPEKVNPTLELPTKKEISGRLSRGARRIMRRLAARDLWAELAVSGAILVIGQPMADAPARIRRDRDSFRKAVLRDPEGWALRLSLKSVDSQIQSGAGKETIEAEIRNMRKQYKDSMPVIYLVNSLYSVIGAHVPAYKKPKEKENTLHKMIDILTYLMLYAPNWIDKAVDECIERQGEKPELFLVESGPRVHLLKRET